MTADSSPTYLHQPSCSHQLNPLPHSTRHALHSPDLLPPPPRLPPSGASSLLLAPSLRNLRTASAPLPPATIASVGVGEENVSAAAQHRVKKKERKGCVSVRLSA
eukprot:1340482-Rhodomonas_salina.3